MLNRGERDRLLQNKTAEVTRPHKFSGFVNTLPILLFRLPTWQLITAGTDSSVHHGVFQDSCSVGQASFDYCSTNGICLSLRLDNRHSKSRYHFRSFHA